MSASSHRAMPTQPVLGWVRGAVQICAVPDRAFMGLVDPAGNAWESYFPLPRRCRPGTREWEQLERHTRTERHAVSHYEHALAEVDGEWWWVERFVLDGRSNLQVAPPGMAAVDHWRQQPWRRS